MSAKDAIVMSVGVISIIGYYYSKWQESKRRRLKVSGSSKFFIEALKKKNK